MGMTCGEATIKLLKAYGVRTIFGIPGVHTLEFCRGLDKHVNHIQTRHEQGAGFMAEGWARATGEPGVALVISGPGVTNATTAVAQSYCDSLPLLLLSAEPPSHSLGKGWGVLHEVTEQKKLTEPITAFSATAMRASDVPELLAKAFTIFASARPRPVHISVPIDVQAEVVKEEWSPIKLPSLSRTGGDTVAIESAAELLKSAKNPVIMVGGGAVEASRDLIDIAEATGAIVANSSAAKGIVPDDHPLCMGSAMVRPEGRAIIENADLILAVGTELSETDSYVEKLEFSGKIIRIDIDPAKINDRYPAEIGIVADASNVSQALKAALTGHRSNRTDAEARIAELRHMVRQNLTKSEAQHIKLLDKLDEITCNETIFAGDACQIAYTGAFAKPMRKPRQWFFGAGYCTLGYALPNAIGAKMAKPDSPVTVLVGDGGFMFTMPELMVAAEHQLALPIILWENGGLKQIQDDMDARDINRVGVEPLNPDFVALAEACRSHGVRPQSMDEFVAAYENALAADRPTVIVVEEGSHWLK